AGPPPARWCSPRSWWSGEAPHRPGHEPVPHDHGGSGAGTCHIRSRHTGQVIYRFPVGRLRCAVISDGQPQPPWEPPLETFFTPSSGVPDQALRAAVAAEGQGRTTLACGYNCLLVETPAGQAVIDSGL